MAPKKKAAARKTSGRAKRKATSANRKPPGPRKASAASIATRDAYVVKRPMRGFYLDSDQVDFIEDMRRVAPGPKIPSASEIVRAMLRDFMNHHPIGDRSTAATKRKPPDKK